MITEDAAIEFCYCPMMFNLPGQNFCKGSACMAWRWIDPSEEERPAIGWDKWKDAQKLIKDYVEPEASPREQPATLFAPQRFEETHTRMGYCGLAGKCSRKAYDR